MTKEEVIDLLKQLEKGIIKGNYADLWYDGTHNECWKILDCQKKSCPAYGRHGVRCWQVHNNYCTSESCKNEFPHSWSDCEKCEVSKKVIVNEEIMVRELINNIIFALNNFDQSTLYLLKIKKSLSKITEFFKLTNRENSILLLLLERLSRKEMTKSLGISEETVKMHIQNIYKKMDVHSKNKLFEKLSEFCENDLAQETQK